MASKQPFKLFDIKKMAVKTWLNTRDFVKHNILMQKKNILIIGDNTSAFYKQFTNNLSSRWSVNNLNESNYFKYSQEEMTVKYKQAEKQFERTSYEAIVVLPEIQSKDNTFNFEDEGLATKFPNYFLNSIFRNVLAYKIASKHLSKTGVIILSCNQKEFYNLKPFQYQQHGRGRVKMQLKENPYKEYCISNCLSDGAVTYLGLILGERYQLDLNSHSVIALSNQQSIVEQEPIAKLYAQWVNHRNLPQPGSFARFISPNQKVQKLFVEYL